MQDYFKIIMQLHAEGEAPAASTGGSEPAAAPKATPEPSAPATPEPQDTQPVQPQPAATPTPAAPKPDYTVIADTGSTQLVMDANGQKRIIDVPQPSTEPAPATPEPQDTQPVQPQPAATPQQPEVTPAPLAAQPQPLPAYTPDELILAIQFGSVDESRIPPNLMIPYGQFKERQAREQAIASGQQAANQTQKPDETQQRIQFMRDVDATAHEMTLKQLGLTEEDIANEDYNDYSDNPDLKERVNNFKDLKEYNKQQIFAAVQQQRAQAQQQAQAQQAVNNEILAFTQKEIQTETKFTEINQELEKFYKSLPYDKGAKYAAALNAYKAGKITEAQAKDLQEYYDETKKMVYARANNLSTTPTPVVRRPASVESPGTGLDTQPKHANPQELRDLDYMGKLAWFRENL